MKSAVQFKQISFVQHNLIFFGLHFNLNFTVENNSISQITGSIIKGCHFMVAPAYYTKPNLYSILQNLQ